VLKLLSRYVSARSLFLLGSEALLIVSVIWVAWAWQRASLEVPVAPMSGVVVAVAALCLVSLYSHNLYLRSRTKPTRESFAKILQSIGFAAVLIVGVNILVPKWRIAGGAMIGALVVLPFALILWRGACARLLKSRAFDRTVLLVGVGRLAEDLVGTLNAEPDIAYAIAARLPEFKNGNGTGVAVPGDGRRASDMSLLEFVRQARIDHVVIALSDSRGKLPFDELLRCKFSGVKIEDGLSFYERITGRVHLDALKPSWMIFSDGFGRPRVTAVFKRMCDVVGSLVGLSLVAPLGLAIAALIKLDSSGPILYRQERVGEGGRPFTLLKFRSMGQDAEAATGPVWATDGDGRATRLGKWLRKFRLDELPQMINVLRGDMSFVGPRPERPCFVEDLKNAIPYYGLRHAVRPGITGWAQVRYHYGSNVQDTIEKLQYDLYYIKNMSIFLDATILVQTAQTVLLGRGAR
jgi:sugar transferase (PEP-CTERM system associated)